MGCGFGGSSKDVNYSSNPKEIKNDQKIILHKDSGSMLNVSKQEIAIQIQNTMPIKGIF